VQILVALTVGLVFWLAAWALGIGAFDAFMVTILLVTTAATARIVTPFVKDQLGR
jgi:uncharacterized integral membrane protein